MCRFGALLWLCVGRGWTWVAVRGWASHAVLQGLRGIQTWCGGTFAGAESPHAHDAWGASHTSSMEGQQPQSSRLWCRLAEHRRLHQVVLASSEPWGWQPRRAVQQTPRRWQWIPHWHAAERLPGAFHLPECRASFALFSSRFFFCSLLAMRRWWWPSHLCGNGSPLFFGCANVRNGGTSELSWILDVHVLLLLCEDCADTHTHTQRHCSNTLTLLCPPLSFFSLFSPGAGSHNNKGVV